MSFDKKKYDAKANNLKSKSNTRKFVWFYGNHVCTAALQNPERKIYRVLIKCYVTNDTCAWTPNTVSSQHSGD